MKKGFNRLKGAAVIGAMGLGLFGAGSGRAATVSTGVSVAKPLLATVGGSMASASFAGIANTTLTSSSSSGGVVFSTFLTSISIGPSTFTTFTTSNRGSAFAISEFSVSANSASAYSDGFDGALAMFVDGTGFVNPDTTVDLTGDVVTTDTVVGIVPGIDAQIKYQFIFNRGGTSVGLIRAMYTLTNTTLSPISTSVSIVGNLGSDNSTTVQSSSSGDLVADDTDLWTVSSGETGGGDPVIGGDINGDMDPVLVITRFGTGPAITPTATMVLAQGLNDNFGNAYNLTIPANSTQRIVVFVEGHKTNAGASAAALDFETLEAANAKSLLDGLNSKECGEIVNYDVTLTACATLPAPPAPAAKKSSGAFNSLTLLSVAGLAGLFRLGRKKRD